MENILSIQSEAILELPFEAKFKIEDDSMIPKNEKNKHEVWKMYPVRIGTVIRIAGILDIIKIKDIKLIIPNVERDFSPECIKLIEQHGSLLIECICLAFWNKKGDFPKWWRDFFKFNCTWKDIHKLFSACLFRMGVKHFCKATIQANRMGLNKVSEMIADMNLSTN